MPHPDRIIEVKDETATPPSQRPFDDGGPQEESLTLNEDRVEVPQPKDVSRARCGRSTCDAELSDEPTRRIEDSIVSG